MRTVLALLLGAILGLTSTGCDSNPGAPSAPADIQPQASDGSGKLPIEKAAEEGKAASKPGKAPAKGK